MASSNHVHHCNKAANVDLPNKLLNTNENDLLYHLGIAKTETAKIAQFTNIKFVCTGGSPSRIFKYAEIFAKKNSTEISENLSSTDRFSMYITGPVLWINHGMGVPSLTIMLTECIKLLHYAKASGYKIVRLGTSGGIGVEPGTVIIANGVMNGLFEQKHVQYINGKRAEYDACLDKEFGDLLFEIAKRLNIPVDRGITFCADDFYEGQMRLNGLFCDYSPDDKMAFLKKLHSMGVRNIEMESIAFAAYTHRLKIPAAIMCVTILNRLISDQVNSTKDTYHEMESRPFRIICELIQSSLK